MRIAATGWSLVPIPKMRSADRMRCAIDSALIQAGPQFQPPTSGGYSNNIPC